MRATASIIIAAAAAGTLWIGVTSVQNARADAGRPAVAPYALAKPETVTDVDRRAQLNARLHTMIRDGKGGRLTDPKPVAPRREAAPRARSAPSATRRPARAQAPARSSRAEPTSTIAPPAYDPARARTSGGLDLTTPPVIPADPVECLTQAVYYEARSESEDGQAAVAEVVLNRADSGRYPGDICAVVYQRNSRTCQFTFTCDGSIGRFPVNAASWARAERIAREVYAGRSQTLLPRSAVNYHANYVRPTWSSRLERVRRIGAHIFYGKPLHGSNPGADEAPARPRQRGLLFVKDDALERAYALFAGKPADDRGS